MLRLTQTFDVQTDIISSVLAKEESVRRSKGECVLTAGLWFHSSGGLSLSVIALTEV